ncbi:hypothetical protein SPHV1_2270190 [Novosphingobium sp. KN65.2]|nr:hypothetical protein SPHV1_2270190 [Novosphingobium sp. KN65.2]
MRREGSMPRDPYPLSVDQAVIILLGGKHRMEILLSRCLWREAVRWRNREWLGAGLDRLIDKRHALPARCLLGCSSKAQALGEVTIAG